MSPDPDSGPDLDWGRLGGGLRSRSAVIIIHTHVCYDGFDGCLFLGCRHDDEVSVLMQRPASVIGRRPAGRPRKNRIASVVHFDEP